MEQTTTTEAQCSECGTDVPGDAPLGLCPACLLKRAMQATTAGAGRSAGGGWEPPTVEKLLPLFPHLEILEFIGRGGMGAVYKARQVHLDRFVAVKILPTTIADDPAFAERFAREARSLARLNHANIVTVHDFGRAGEFFFFVMEFVDGANLRQALAAKTLEPRQALAIVPQICDALQYAHDEGIVHRDIKPENVLLDRKGRVKIADFGLAKLLQKTPQNYTLTQTYVTMGTPHYMAPEQTERPLEVDHRADIYSLGVVFYEMLTGELPLGRFAPPSAKAPVDARLDEVVFKTLEKDPQRRYQQASEVKTGVQAVLPYAQPHPPPPPMPGGYPRYSRVAAAGAILGALGLFSLFVTIPLGLLLGRVAAMAVPFLLVAFACMIAMPVCGFVAIGQIRRANGQMSGLRLAVFDALAVPLLLLDLLVLAVMNVVLLALASVGFSWAEMLLVSSFVWLPLCVVVDFLILRFVWRRVSAGLPEAPASPSRATHVGPVARPKQPKPVLAYGEGARYSRTALAGAAWAVVGLAAPLLILAGYFVVGRSTPVGAAVPTPPPPTRTLPTAPGASTLNPPRAPYGYSGSGSGGSGAGQRAVQTTPPRPGSPPEAGTPRANVRSPAAGAGGGSGRSRTLAPATAPAQPFAVPGAPVIDPEWPDKQSLLEAAELDIMNTYPSAARGTTVYGVRPTTAPTTNPAQVRRWSYSAGGRGGGGGSVRSTTPGGANPFAVAPPVAPAAPTTPSLISMLAPTAQLALFPLLAVSFTAPFGATILGLVALSQIRQSNGKLYGMPLAVFDTLVFPLLLLDGLIVGGLTALVDTALPAPGRGLTMSVVVLLSVLIAIAIDIWIVRRVRDAANNVPATA